MPTDEEPAPRLPAARPLRLPLPEDAVPLSRSSIREPDTTFLDVLRNRRSRVGRDLSEEDLSSLLWHATALRERSPIGRFGIPWESRPTPSAAGLNALRILVMPLHDPALSGEYLPDRHALAAIRPEALRLNRDNVAELLGECGGTTLQLACDEPLIEACYENSSSIIWREAGAMAAVISLTAEALGLSSVLLGRIGSAILAATDADHRLAAVGAIHIGAARPV